MDHTTLQPLSPTWWEKCVPPAAARAGEGQQCSVSVGGAGGTGEKHDSESESFLAVQTDPAMHVAPVSGLGYHHLLSTWHTFCQPARQTQLFMNNAN